MLTLLSDGPALEPAVLGAENGALGALFSEAAALVGGALGVVVAALVCAGLGGALRVVAGLGGAVGVVVSE